MSESGYFDLRVCESGHVITDMATRLTGITDPHCPKCGSKTISACPSCTNPIQGRRKDSPALQRPVSPQPFCKACGKPMPWAVTSQAIEFDGLIEEFSLFVDGHIGSSVRGLIGEIATAKPASGMSAAIDKANAIGRSYWMFRELRSSEQSIPSSKLAAWLRAFHSVIRAYEDCVSDLVTMIGMPGELRTATRDLFMVMQGRYNSWLVRFEELNRAANVTLPGFSRIPEIGSIPARPLPQAGQVILAAGQTFDGLHHVRALLKNAKNEVFICDRYVDESIFELFLFDVPGASRIRLLYRRQHGRFDVFAKKFMEQHSPRCELRRTRRFHDRVFFIDGQCWVAGQSMKDLAIDAPAYVVEIQPAEQMRSIYEALWREAQPGFKET